MGREVAQLRAVLGRQLAARRRAAGLSQQALASLVLRDRTTVAKIEAGQRVADAMFWRTADDHCRAEGALLETFAQLCAAEQASEAQDQETRRARAQTEIAQLQAEVAALVPDGEDDGSAPARHGDPDARGLMGELLRLADAVDRRTLMRLLRSLCLAAGLPMPTWEPEEQERVTRAVVGRRLDARVLGILEKTWECVKRQEDALGPRTVQSTALAHRDTIVGLFPRCPAPLRPRLLTAYADVSISLSFYAFDEGDPARAQRHCEAARAAAHEAEDPEMTAYALCNIAYFASVEGARPHVVLDAASAARSLAAESGNQPLHARVLEKVAAGHALTGGYKACASTLDQAQRTLSAGPRAESAAPRSPAYFYGEGTLATGASVSLLRCGRPQEAAENATTGLRLLDEQFIGLRGFCTVHLANARIASGEVEEAADVLGGAADLATLHRSARLEGAIHATRERMIPWHATRSVKNLDDRLVSCGLWIPGTHGRGTEA